MKTDAVTHIICKGFCSFYREGKEESTCGAYGFLSEALTSGELSYAVRNLPSAPDYSHDEAIRELVCDECDFLVDGCDFREGLPSPPCGGYTIVEGLLAGRGERP